MWNLMIIWCELFLVIYYPQRWNEKNPFSVMPTHSVNQKTQITSRLGRSRHRNADSTTGVCPTRTRTRGVTAHLDIACNDLDNYFSSIRTSTFEVWIMVQWALECDKTFTESIRIMYINEYFNYFNGDDRHTSDLKSSLFREVLRNIM